VRHVVQPVPLSSLAERPSIIAIPGRRAAGMAPSQDLVKWADEELAGDLDSPGFRKLAGLFEPLCWSQVELTFETALD
jgi:hypothetical protein